MFQAFPRGGHDHILVLPLLTLPLDVALPPIVRILARLLELLLLIVLAQHFQSQPSRLGPRLVYVLGLRGDVHSLVAGLRSLGIPPVLLLSPSLVFYVDNIGIGGA